MKSNSNMSLFKNMMVRSDKYLDDVFAYIPTDMNITSDSKLLSVENLKYVEDAYNQLVRDRENTLDPDSRLMYDVGFHSCVYLTPDQVEKNILAWYQYYDELVCGEK